VATLVAVSDPRESDYLALGEAIRLVRKKWWKLTQDEFASLGGWTDSTIRRWEKGGQPKGKNVALLEHMLRLRGPYYQLPPRAELEALRPRGEGRELALLRELRRLMQDEGADAATLERLIAQLRAAEPEQ
jgi:transcriptional regulator with XRE-family HTH domain